jgi:hypothetical protein
MESCFLVSTGLTLVALERSAARALGAAAACAALAPLVFAGGVVAPWLCLLYVLVFDRRDRRALAAFAAIGIAALVVILASSSALDSARAVATGAPLAEIAGFVVRGAIASSLASLLALRGHAWLAATLLGALALHALARGEGAARTLRSLAFAGAWLVGAYALQAAVRTGTGYGEAMAFRYTYFGMTAAAFAVAAAVDPLLRTRRRLAACACIAGVLVATGFNAAIFASRMEREEGEYFAIARQYFAVTDAAIRAGVPLSAAVLPKTLLPQGSGISPARYQETVCWLSGCRPGGAPAPMETEAAIAALLSPGRPP